jgi:hypothetical protein
MDRQPRHLVPEMPIAGRVRLGKNMPWGRDR